MCVDLVHISINVDFLIHSEIILFEQRVQSYLNNKLEFHEIFSYSFGSHDSTFLRVVVYGTYWSTVPVVLRTCSVMNFLEKKFENFLKVQEIPFDWKNTGFSWWIVGHVVKPSKKSVKTAKFQNLLNIPK